MNTPRTPNVLLRSATSLLALGAAAMLTVGCSDSNWNVTCYVTPEQPATPILVRPGDNLTELMHTYTNTGAVDPTSGKQAPDTVYIKYILKALTTVLNHPSASLQRLTSQLFAPPCKKCV